MKHLIPPTGRRTRQAILLSALLAASAGAHAAGTLSGETISNTATLTYSVGTVAQTPVDSNEASFVVDNKVDVLVTGGTTVTTGVVAGATGIESTFTVTNEGNTTQDFKLDIVSTISGDDFDPGSCAVTNVTGAGTYTAGDNHINALAPDAVATVTVSCAIPAGVSNDNDGLVALVATARANDAADTMGAALSETGTATNGVDIVFADSAGTDDIAITGDANGLRDAAHSDRNTYTVTTAVLSVTKAVTTICDPLNGTTNPKNIPGAYVQYAITVSNASTTAATLTQVQDTLVSELAFDGELISGGTGTAAECASGGPSLSASGFGVVTGSGTSTSHTAPGLDTQAVTTGATASGQAISISYGTLSTDTSATLAPVLSGGVLPGNSYITVYFNAIIQ